MEVDVGSLGGYGVKSGASRTGFVTPRASKGFDVYGLSIDVFLWGAAWL